MRAVRLTQLGCVSVADVPEPVPGPEEVLVRIATAGICGSDRHIVSGEYPAALPVTLGHELDGVVAGIGTGSQRTASPATASPYAIGTRVAIDPNIACMQCRYCRAGLVAHCVDLHAVGVDLDGGLAELVVVPERQVYELPRNLPAGFGALCEPLACCLRAMDHGEVKPGDKVAVFGGGVIGQLLTQLARLAGAQTVLVTRQLERRALAESLGASATIDPACSDVAGAVGGPGGFAPGGVDVAFEAAGVAATFQQAIAAVRHAGTVVVVGAAPSSMTVPISPFDVFERELRIVGSHLNPFTHGRAVELAGSGLLALGRLITRTIDLEDVPAVVMRAPLPDEIKVQVALD